MLRIKKATSTEDLALVKKLLLDYGELRNHDAALGDYASEIDGLPGEYAPPDGELLLALYHKLAAGCVALHKIGAGICEMKRLYVLSDFQGKGIGKALVAEVIRIGRERGYTLMRLDTHPWMTAAKSIYLACGFKEIPAYRYNPTPGIRFFELDLQGG